MKILCLVSNYPYSKGEAIEVVAYEILWRMAEAGHKLVVQVIVRDQDTPFHRERRALAESELAGLDIHFAEPVFLAQVAEVSGPLGRAWRAIRLSLSLIPGLGGFVNPALFPADRLNPYISRLADEHEIDILISIWSWESLAASWRLKGVPMFCYYGNPDHKPAQAQLDYPELFGTDVTSLMGRLRQAFFRRLNRMREIQHNRMMRAVQMTANNSLVDKEYYEEKGHPCSIYLNNMWPEADRSPAWEETDLPPSPAVICGSVGNLGATGNTFGLAFIGKQLAPALEDRLGSDGFRVDIYGGGEPNPGVAPHLNHPAIRRHGWVDDLNTAICRSHVFLVLTNVDGFIVGNTRILLAWSLGACLVAHRDSALSMPEIRHGENALLGDDAASIAECIARAAADENLRRTIGEGGLNTYKAHYRSQEVVPRMLQAMERCIEDYNPPHRS